MRCRDPMRALTLSRGRLLTLVMQTETVPHTKVMKSLEMFGKYVLPAFRPVEHAGTSAAI
jgi:hypothetical protein